MSRLRFTATALAVAAITGMNFASAQESPSGNQSPTAQAPSTQTGQSERYEARRVSADTNREGLTVTQAIVQKLKKVNEAEIELAKMAQQKSENEDLQKLTKMLIEDHQSLNQELQQSAGQQQARRSGEAQATRSDRTGAQDSAARQESAAREGQASRAGQTGQAGQAGQAGRAGQATRAGQASRGDQQAGTSRGLTGAAGSQSETVPQQLVQIAEQACDNALKMTKETLNEHDGRDFDMAFLGQQCFAHTMMLAELKAIQSSGPEELQEVAEKAISKVENHLEKVKQLAKKLADDRSKSSQE